MKKENYDVMGTQLEDIRNMNEKKVVQIMNELIPKNKDFDNCSMCIQDIYALSLNQIAPKYTQEGTIILKKKSSFKEEEEEIREVVRSAIETIIKYPKHPCKTK